MIAFALIFPALSSQAQEQDPASTASIQKYLAKYYGKEAAENKKFIYSAVDLNDDRKNEYLVGLVGNSFCGTGGCTMLVLTSKFTLNTRMTVVGFPVYVGPPGGKEVTKGYSNLYMYSKGKGYVKMVWNGSKYPTNPSMAPSIKEELIKDKHAFLDEKTSQQFTF